MKSFWFYSIENHPYAVIKTQKINREKLLRQESNNSNLMSNQTSQKLKTQGKINHTEEKDLRQDG